jgi:hypothetical protein
MFDNEGQTERPPMLLYYLHIRDGTELLLDPEGSNLPNLEAARAEAIEGARQLISEAVRTGSPLHMQRAFQIDDADGHTLLSVPRRVFGTSSPLRCWATSRACQFGSLGSSLPFGRATPYGAASWPRDGAASAGSWRLHRSR